MYKAIRNGMIAAAIMLPVLVMARPAPPSVIPVVTIPTKQFIAQVSPSPPGPTSRIIPALIGVRIEILASLDSSLNKPGDMFPIRLGTPIDLGDGLTVPTGTSGQGQVVHAAKSRFGGKPGEMILAARYLDFEGVHIPLRSLTFASGAGKDQGGLAMGMAIAGGAIGGVASLFITGGEVRIPFGTTAFAKTAIPVIVTPPPPAPPPLLSTTIITKEGMPKP